MSAPPPSLSPPLVKQTTFIGIVWGGFSVGTLALAFRYWVRIKCFRRLLADDFLTGFAWILLFATAILWQIIAPDLYEITEVGAGVRMPSVNFIENAERFLKGSLAALFIFYVGLWTIKMNFLIFFYRLGNQVTYYRIAWWAVTVFTVCAGFVCLGTIQYRCLTRSFAIVNTQCLGESAIRFQDITLKFNMALDVFTDALIMGLPISILWNVRISMRRRFALVGLFSLVIITMIVAIVRVSVVTRAAATSSQSKQVEMTWLYMWHFIESSVALLVACLASFRALFANKERSREQEEAREREKAAQGSHSLRNLKAIKARAKFFQDSLFSTEKEADRTVGSIVGGPLQRLESGSVNHSGPESCELQRETHQTKGVSALNTHGLT